ncbi:NAD(P)H-binding protein [Solirubrobacter phytolaccae]|uniref:NAD(P)H-binding protein n=1 Tax=Solirubrobacter phytolaccae TaxID=1404360 RepID=A0A9X3NET4_9ACTN|nr:NAD(P)H-binding protein [Solirubrobacter phytolaccae]MDA0182741.1 NAD(P)H-binding protein [Solirubrobacter phytolaccae]
MTTLITGATGKTGTRIIERLTAAGVAVRPASRATGFDWEDRSTWAAALAGADAAYLAYYPDLAMPGAADILGAFARQAEAAGVGRLVLLSGRGEPEAQRAEQEVAGAGVPWTIVRCSWFAQNFSESFMLDGVLSGDVALPAGDTPEPFVDAEDIADVAFAALTEHGHAGQVYELTGPRALRMDEAVAELAAATGRELRFTRITPEQYRAAAPPELADFVVFLFTELLDGRNAQPQDGVRRALGRAPRDFGEFARRTAATGVWATT